MIHTNIVHSYSISTNPLPPQLGDSCRIKDSSHQDLISVVILNNILHLPQLELLSSKFLAGEFDASSSYLMQFQTHSELRESVLCHLNAYSIEVFYVYPTTCRGISAPVKVSKS